MMVASLEFYLEADAWDGYRYVIEPARVRKDKVIGFHVKKVPPRPSHETPIRWLGPPARSLGRAKAIAQADHDKGNDAVRS
jgi:hypothetical protein